MLDRPFITRSYPFPTTNVNPNRIQIIFPSIQIFTFRLHCRILLVFHEFLTRIVAFISEPHQFKCICTSFTLCIFFVEFKLTVQISFYHFYHIPEALLLCPIQMHLLPLPFLLLIIGNLLDSMRLLLAASCSLQLRIFQNYTDFLLTSFVFSG